MPDVAASTRLPAPGVTLAWLHAGQLPPELLQRVEQGAQALLAADAAWPDGVEPAAAWRDDGGQPLLSAARLGQGRLLRFERALAPAEMPQLLAPEFPHVLRELLQPPPAPTVVGAVDYAPEAGAVAVAAEPFDLRPWRAPAIPLPAPPPCRARCTAGLVSPAAGRARAVLAPAGDRGAGAGRARARARRPGGGPGDAMP